MICGGCRPPFSGIGQRPFFLVAVELFPPFGGVAGRRQRQQILQGRFRVAVAADIGLHELAELRGIDIDMDLHGILAELARYAENAVVETRAHGHHQVAFHDRAVGIGGAVHARSVEAQRMRIREHALAQQGRCHRNLQFFRQRQQFVLGVRQDRSVASDDQRSLALRQGIGDLLEGFRYIALRFRLVARQVHLGFEAHRAGFHTHVLGHVDQHRARTTGRRDVKGFLDHPGDIVGVFQQIAMLDDRHRQVEHVRFLEGILAQHAPHALAGDHDHRHRIHMGRQDARDGIGRAGSARHEHCRRLAGRPRVAIGHVGRALLVPHQHELHVVLYHIQGIEQGNRRSARQSEHDLDSHLLQATDQRLSPVHLVFTHLSPL